MVNYHIGYFPVFYPDELVYSACARFSDHMGYQSPTLMRQELFGMTSSKIVFDLPSNLEHLVSVIPYRITFNKLLLNHTVYPYYVPFLPPKRIQAIVEGLRGRRKTGLNLILGLASNGIVTPNYLQFCPECADYERREYGECYWHRLHQLPGVKVCPEHKIWLEDSQVKTHNNGEWISAQRGISAVSPRQIDLNHSSARDFLMIACATAWLLCHGSEYLTTYPDLRLRYLLHFANGEFASYRNRIRTTHLLSAFQERYKTDFLEALGCQVFGRYPRNWVARIGETGSTQHPLRHILVINLLSITVEDFLKQSLNWRPFGSGPWPCLNPTCPYYTQPVIASILQGHSARHSNRPLGTFRCDHCDFTYVRVGPDSSEEDRLFGRPIHYGHVWERTLRDVWDQNGLTQVEKAKLLGVCRETFLNQAHKLGLYKPSVPKQRSSKSELPDIKHYRDTWTEILKNHPKATLVELIKGFPQTYGALKRYDSKWLESHKPKIRTITSSKRRVDWKSLEDNLLGQIDAITDSIRHRRDPFQRVTINQISKELGFADGYLHKHLPKLPTLTAKLQAVVEDHESYAVRRIQMHELEWDSSETEIALSTFIKKCGLSRSVQTPKVMEEIHAALERLRRK